METDRHSDEQMARLLAFASVCSAHLADAAAQVLADALELHCTGVLTDDLGDDVALLTGRRELVTDAAADAWVHRLGVLRSHGVWATFVCDAAYPTNLRMAFNRPPLLFARGTINPADDRAVAVVGTRAASAGGLAAATAIAGGLAESRVTVVSGLARGIDIAAHAAALDAGGRTIAVLGQGLGVRLPASQAPLARRIEHAGAVVSQWWPEQPVTRWTLPLRNIVTSGLSTATIVVEAGETSGAKLQAHDALRHGKRVYVVDRLVTGQSWARTLIDDGLVVPITIDDIDMVVATVTADVTAESHALV